MTTRDYIEVITLTYSKKSYTAEVKIKTKLITLQIDDMNIINAIKKDCKKFGVTKYRAYEIIYKRAKKIYDESKN